MARLLTDLKNATHILVPHPHKKNPRPPQVLVLNATVENSKKNKISLLRVLSFRYVENSIRAITSISKLSNKSIFMKFWGGQFFDLISEKPNFQVGGGSFCVGVAPKYWWHSSSQSKVWPWQPRQNDLTTFTKIQSGYCILKVNFDIWKFWILFKFLVFISNVKYVVGNFVFSWKQQDQNIDEKIGHKNF